MAMNNLLKVLGVCTLIFFLSLWLVFPFMLPLAILSNTTSTKMKVSEVVNPENLAISFLDSERAGDDDFMFYEFKFNSFQPYTLEKLIISNGGERREIDYFYPGKDTIRPSKELTSKDKDQVILIGEKRLLTNDMLNGSHKNKMIEFLTVKNTTIDTLHLEYYFKEGIIQVEYFFKDVETNALYTHYFFLAILITMILLPISLIVLESLEKNKLLKK